MQSGNQVEKKTYQERSSSDDSDVDNEKLNFINKHFKDNSDMNSQTSNENSDSILNTNQDRNNYSLDMTKSNNYSPPVADGISTRHQINEKKLSEIGFKATDIQDWDEITQPQKEDLLDLVHDMIRNLKKTDVKIVIGSKTCNCHMIVLQCYSQFFMKLTTKEHVVILPEQQVTPEAFTMIYGWMLAKQPKVKREFILELFNAAAFLKIKGILDQCWACLDDDKRFREDTAFLLYLEAGKYNHDSREQIQQLMLTRICKFFLTLVASKEFLEMSPKEICTLLESNTIGVYSETEVLMAAIRWLHFDFPMRQNHTVEVMKCIRFGLIAPWQLVELKRNTFCIEIQKIVEDLKVQNMIDDGLSYVTTKYYYGNREDEFLEGLERLKLYEPVERQWICDKTWAAHEHCLNKQIITYDKFLQYLDYIRSKGKDHWKELDFNEYGPYADYHLQVRPGEAKYFDDYCKFDKIHKFDLKQNT